MGWEACPLAALPFPLLLCFFFPCDAKPTAPKGTGLAPGLSLGGATIGLTKALT